MRGIHFICSWPAEVSTWMKESLATAFTISTMNLNAMANKKIADWQLPAASVEAPVFRSSVRASDSWTFLHPFAMGFPMVIQLWGSLFAELILNKSCPCTTCACASHRVLCFIWLTSHESTPRQGNDHSHPFGLHLEARFRPAVMVQNNFDRTSVIESRQIRSLKWIHWTCPVLSPPSNVILDHHVCYLLDGYKPIQSMWYLGVSQTNIYESWPLRFQFKLVLLCTYGIRSSWT